MKRLLAALVSFAIAACAIAAADPAKPIDLTLQWRASVDADGKLIALQAADDQHAELYRQLDADVRTWHFASGKVDGVPTAAETTLTVHLRLTPVDGGYHVDVRDAQAGPGYGRMTPPKYPDGAVMSHRGGGVLLRVAYDADGRVTGAETIEGGFPKPGNDIEHSALAAVKSWTFRPESIGGHGRPGVAIVPMCFSVGPGAREAKCRFTDPVTRHAIEDGGLLAVDPLVRVEMTPHAP
ncbi:MAG: TonB family protein [Rhodanobacteraceae bacterium]